MNSGLCQQRDWLESSLADRRWTSTQAMPIRQALSSRTVLVVTAAYVFNNFTYYSLLFWLPSMMKHLTGFSDVRVGALGALPYVGLFFGMLVNGWHSDRQLERRWHTAVPVLLSAAGFLGLVYSGFPLCFNPAIHGRDDWQFLSASAVGDADRISNKSAAAAAVGMINAIGSISGFAGPYLFGYLSTKSGSFGTGLTVLMVTALTGGLIVLYAPEKKV